MVSCDKNGKLSVYDLKAALTNKDESKYDYLLKTSPAESQGRGFSRENEMVADDEYDYFLKTSPAESQGGCGRVPNRFDYCR